MIGSPSAAKWFCHWVRTALLLVSPLGYMLVLDTVRL